MAKKFGNTRAVDTFIARNLGIIPRPVASYADALWARHAFLPVRDVPEERLRRRLQRPGDSDSRTFMRKIKLTLQGEVQRFINRLLISTDPTKLENVKFPRALWSLSFPSGTWYREDIIDVTYCY